VDGAVIRTLTILNVATLIDATVSEKTWLLHYLVLWRKMLRDSDAPQAEFYQQILEKSWEYAKDVNVFNFVDLEKAYENYS